MEVYVLSNLLQDVAHEGRAKHKIKFKTKNGKEFIFDKIIRNDESNEVDIILIEK